MNAEQLIEQAINIIARFSAKQHMSCFLSVSHGRVYARKAKKAPAKHPTCLFISVDEQIHGLPATAWRTIGASLLTLYNKEQSCQANHKP